MNDNRRSDKPKPTTQPKLSPTKARLRRAADVLLQAAWHTSLNYEDEDGDRSHLVVYPSYDPEDMEDEPMVRIETIEIEGETLSSTSQLWSPAELARFCRSTLAALESDGSLDVEDDDDDDDEEEQESGDEEEEEEDEDGEGDEEPDDDE